MTEKNGRKKHGFVKYLEGKINGVCCCGMWGKGKKSNW